MDGAKIQILLRVSYTETPVSAENFQEPPQKIENKKVTLFGTHFSRKQHGFYQISNQISKILVGSWFMSRC